MASGKETPRQKMIGMMYLVLTALLALNVSEEFLNAFKLVNDGLESTTANFATANQITYKAFESAMKNSPGKTKPYWDKAQQAQKYATDLNAYVADLKAKMITAAGGISEETGDITARSDMEASAQLMVVQNNGKELKKRILDTREKLLSLVDPKDRPNFSLSLNAVDPPVDKEGVKKSWESKNFEGLPVTAAVTVMSKIQNDIKNAEADIVNYLLKSVDATDFKFDQLNAVVVAPTSYVLVGQQYEAEVFLTAYDSKQAPEIVVGGRTLPTEEGKGKYKVVPTSEGVVKWGGVIRVKSPDGSPKDYKFESEYQAAKPSATISADKMNVFYIGVDNPVSISAPGIAKTKLRPSLQGKGSITGSNGSYIVRVTEPGKVMVTVSGEMSKGEYKTLGGMEYRVKRVPDPVAKVGGVMSGNMSAGQLRAQKGVFAVLDNFDFDLKFTVKRFDLIVLRARQDPQRISGSSAALTPEMMTALGGLGPKDKVFFSEIIASGPDGTNRKLNDVVINVQ